MNSWFSGAAGSSTVGQKSVAQMAPAPKAPGFFSDLGHSIAAVPGQVASAVYHGIADPFAHLVNNNINVANQGANSRSIDQRRQALDANSHDLLKQYSSGKISKDQYNQASKTQMKAYTDLQSEAQGNINSVKGFTQMLPDALQAAGTVATLGAGGLGGGAVKAGAEALGARVAGQTGAKVAGKVVQAGADIIGAGKGAGGAITTPLKDTSLSTLGHAATQLPGKIVRNAVLTQPTIQAPAQITNDVKTGNLGNLALDAALPIAGVAAVKLAPYAAQALSKLFRSDRGLSNALQFKDGTIQSVLSDLQAKAASGDPKAAADYAKMFDQAKVSIDHMNAENRSPEVIAAYQRMHGNPTEGMTVQEFLQQNHNLASASTTYQKLAASGKLTVDSAGVKAVPKELVGRVGAGKFDQSEKADLIQRLSAVPSAERGAIFANDTSRGLDYTRNPNVYNAVQNAAVHSDPALMAKAIHDINGTHSLTPAQGRSATLNKLLSEGSKPKVPGGYIPIIKPEGAAGFNAPKNIDNAILDTKRGALAGVTDAARKVGLSMSESPAGSTKATLKANFAEALAGKGVQGDANAIFKQLNKATDRAAGAFDPRALTKRQIESALSSVAPEANPGTVRKAYTDAMAKLPASQVGLGQSVLNKTLGKSALFNKYMKVQAIGRYEMNPIFWAKQDIKSTGIAAVEGARLGVKTTTEDALALKNNGFLSDKGRGGSDYSVSADSSSSETGQLMRPNQQRIVKWLASSIADAHGTTVSKILEDGGPLADQMKQSLSLVHSYGSGGYLNSPFAKTLNLVVFPSRFATKVGIEASKVLDKMPVATQAATIHSLAQGVQWAKSPDGQQWQKDNSELVGLIKYFTPLTELSSVATFVDGGFHAGDLGQLGGLPVGVLGTILSGQGWLPSQLGSSQYLDPKTGVPVPSAIPTTVKARLQTGFASLLGSLFSYPGKTAGLPSKTAVVQLGGKNPLTTPSKSEVKYQMSNGAPAPSTTKLPTIPSFTRASVKDMNLPKANITPIYKNGLPKIKKGKTLARRPGTF